MKKIILSITLLTACFAFADPYAKCVACHGASGEKVAMGKSKIIKDMTKEDFIAALKGYQNGTYGGTQKALMVPQVKNMSEATMKEIADMIIK